MNPYHDGMNGLLQYYSLEYKKDGKSFVKCFLNCPSIQVVCKSIVWVYRKELKELRKPECVEYAKKFDTDRETLADILSLIFYVLN